MKTLGQYIKQKRTALNLTQKQLGQKLGMSQGAVNNWEIAIGAPTSANLKKVAYALEADHHEMIRLFFEYKNAIKAKKEKKKRALKPQKDMTFVVPPSPTGVITFSVGKGGGGGSAQAMTQDGVALKSMEHPQADPEPVAWVDEIWLLRPDITEKLPYEDIFSRSQDENYVPLFERSQIGYTQEQVNRMMDMAAHLERNICAQIVYDTYEGFGAEAQGVDFVKQQIIRQIKERDKL